MLLRLLLIIICSCYSYQLSLWSEGYQGTICKDPSLFSGYLDGIVNFAINKNISQVFYLMLNPTDFLCCEKNNVLNYFINKLPSSKRVGVVGYINPCDSGWRTDLTLPGGNATCELIAPANGECSAYSCGGTFPTGCPNSATQLIEYIGEINNASSTLKFDTLAIDKEGNGIVDPSELMCQFEQAAKIYADNVRYVGMAGGPALTPDQIDATNAYPEYYWIGELAAGGCISYTVTPDECMNTVYVQYKNQPQQLFDVLKPYYDPYKSYLSQPGVVPLFSIENLEYGYTNGNSGPSCLAADYVGVDNPVVCGVFNGFSYWEWDSFMQFLQIFSDEYNVEQIGIYEAQFLPDTWM